MLDVRFGGAAKIDGATAGEGNDVARAPGHDDLSAKPRIGVA